MPVYAESFDVSITYVGASGDPQTGILRISTATLAALTTNTFQQIRLNSTGGVAANRTPEKLNTRSPAPSAKYEDTSPTFTGGAALYKSHTRFNNSHWVAHPRRLPMGFDTQTVTAITQNLTTHAVYIESAENYRGMRGRIRRTTKPGYFSRFGNEINRVATSGGGAFNAIYPVFQNDITWVDINAWRNGMNQSEIFNLPLLTFVPPVVTLAPQRALVGVGQ